MNNLTAETRISLGDQGRKTKLKISLLRERAANPVENCMQLAHQHQKGSSQKAKPDVFRCAHFAVMPIVDYS
jgi:hypothetical protein